MMKHTVTFFFAVVLSVLFIACDTKQAKVVAEPEAPQPLKVLYVTHEPGKWHKYTPQRKMFEKLAKESGWDLTVMSGSHDEVEEKLATQPDFGAGADVIVYNICMAQSDSVDAPYNIISQTKDKGIPALLIHCSLHSFWPTYKEGDAGVHPEGANPKVKAKKELLAQWKKDRPDVTFPAWPNLTGIASTGHPPQNPVEAQPVDASHPIFKGVEAYTTAQNSELYNNFITAEEAPKAKVLMVGTQGEEKAAILWEYPVGKSKSLSFTLGHDMGEWQQKPFQKILVNSVEYLGGH